MIATIAELGGEGWASMEAMLGDWRAAGLRIVSTNGCFDGLHGGHIQLLAAARKEGDRLVVGLNNDASTRALKGEGRPQHPASHRALALAGLRSVDAVVLFSELLPNSFLEAVRPQIHCKGQDYPLEALPEAPLVRSWGGEIRRLPFLPGASSTHSQHPGRAETAEETVLLQMLGAANVLRQTAFSQMTTVTALAEMLVARLKDGHTIFSCGNGGSAADADHFTAELIGHFSRRRGPLSARSLTGDIATFTALANDFGYEQVFARQLEAAGRAGDVLVAISTSGQSANVVRAVERAKSQGIYVVALTGELPGPVGVGADCWIGVPSRNVAWIQQGHRAILHALCSRMEELL